MGSYAGDGTTGVDQTVLIGFFAGSGALTSDADGTVAVGYEAGKAITSGEGNTAIGYQSLRTATENDMNTAVGYQTLYAISGSSGVQGEGNTVMGYKAGRAIITGTQNVMIGQYAGQEVIGNDNLFIGASCASNQTGSRYNIAIGNGSGHYGFGSATGNTIIGHSSAQLALKKGTGYGIDGGTHTGWVTLGYYAGYVVGSGNNASLGATCIGNNAGRYASGSYNTFVGSDAGTGGTTSAPYSSGERNTAVGTYALDAFTTGYGNAVFGYGAGGAINSGNDNTLIGEGAGPNITTGINNTIMGNRAGEAMTTTNNTVLIGRGTGLAINSTDADHTTAVGSIALLALTDGQNNTAVGYGAMQTNSQSHHNTALGYDALRNHETNGAGANTMLGYKAGDSITTGQYNTGVGSNVAFDVDAANQLCLGRTATSDAANKVVIGNASISAAHIQVDWTIDSDRRIKKDIEDGDVGLTFINKLQTRKFKKKHPSEWDAEIIEDRYKKGGLDYDEEKDEPIRDEFDDEKVWDGLIAQEVKDVMDESNVSFSGWYENTKGKQGITYSTLVTPLIKSVQELSSENKRLENKINDLEIFIMDKLGDK